MSFISPKIDLTKVRVKFPKNHTKNVILENNIGITFKYPDIASTSEIENIEDDPITYIATLIESIFDSDNVYDASMLKQEELVEWLVQLTRKQFEKIKEEFFDSMPSMEHTVKYECPKCHKKGSYTFKGISDFF